MSAPPRDALRDDRRFRLGQHGTGIAGGHHRAFGRANAGQRAGQHGGRPLGLRQAITAMSANASSQ